MPARRTINEVREILSCDDEYEIIEPLEYLNSKTRSIHMRHKKCGRDFYIDLDHWISGQRPHRCEYRNSTMKKTTDEFKQEVKNCEDSYDYDVIGEYISKRTKIEMRHISKNHNFFIAPEDFLDGCRCNICFKTHLKTTDDFKLEIKEVLPEYEVVGEYVGANIKLEMKHLKCGKTFFAKPSDLLHDHGCPYCYESKNEKRIEHILIENNIRYEKQKKFDGCVSKQHLRFDFYLPDYNTCIEYDGEWHYKNCLNHIDTLTTQKIRDNIKNKYCAENGIKLIRISYLEKNKIDNLVQMLS